MALFLGGCGALALRLDKGCFLDLLVEADNKFLDMLNIVGSIVADVGHSIDVHDDVGDVGDGGHRVFGSFHDGHVAVDVDHGKLTAIDIVGELLEFIDETVAIGTLFGIKQDQGETLGIVGEGEKHTLISLSYLEIIITKK